MPDPIICPHCQEHLDIPPEYHGRQVRCANCQNIFVALSEADMPVVHRLPERRSGAGGHSSRPHDDRPRPARRVQDDEDDHPPRRANVPVVLALLFVMLTVGGCCGGINLLWLTHTNPEMKAYTSVEGKFKAEFPAIDPVGGPIADAGDDKPAGTPGWQVTANRVNPPERYMIRCYDLKAEWRKLTPLEALELVAKAELAVLAVNTPNPKTEQTTHSGFTALDVRAGQGGGLNGSTTILRCVLAGNRVYVLSVQGQQGVHQFWWVRQFFLSFEITDPAAKPPKDDEPKKKED